MALLKIKRCKECGNRLTEAGYCSNEQCVSYIRQEVSQLVEEIREQEKGEEK